ncbi:hypothetical protein MY8738_003033 [Beauveria namnaoensis]
MAQNLYRCVSPTSETQCIAPVDVFLRLPRTQKEGRGPDYVPKTNE